MSIGWEKVAAELGNLLGKEVIVLSSFSECPGSFRAVLSHLNEDKKILHLRKVNIRDPMADQILSLADCHFILISPNETLHRAFSLRAVRKSKEELILTQESSPISAALRAKIKVGRNN